jgi:hypothetical protein
VGPLGRRRQPKGGFGGGIVWSREPRPSEHPDRLLARSAIVFLVPLTFSPWREEVFAPAKIQVLLILIGLGLFTLGVRMLLLLADLGQERGATPNTAGGVDLWVAVFGVLNVIAFAASLDRAGSWLGRFPEYQGIVTVLAYLASYGLARAAFLTAPTQTRSRALDLLFGVLTAATAVIGAYAIVQRIGLDPLWGFAERPFATMGHANNLAAMLVVGLPGCAAVAVQSRGLARIAAILAGGLGFVALVTSLSRGGWLAALAVAMLAWRCRRPRSGAGRFSEAP